MRNSAVQRIRVITGVVLFIALLLLVRLYQIQILDHEMYVARAESQYVHTVQDLYNRGSVFLTTKDGERVSAATIRSGYVLAINPSAVTLPEQTADALLPIVSFDREWFLERAQDTDRTYVEVVQQVEREKAEAIEALQLPGVSMYRNQWRYYPGEDLAARTIGFVGYGGGDAATILSGRYGLERFYDDVLKRDSKRLSVNFFAEIFSNLGGIVFDTTESRTGDVVTSIEPTVSRMLNQELMKAHDKWQSELTAGIVIDPKTGEIIAFEIVPGFNLNDRKGVDIEAFRNPLVENVYEFGSIMKALTMASGLDSGAVAPHTTYYDSGYIDLDTYTIKNFDGRGRGTVDMQEVLNQSLNTGVSFVVRQMGKEIFRDYFLNLKLGSETGIDLPNETYGLVENLNSPRDVEYATASFGQGIAITPIEAVRALSTLANGGRLITPHIATHIEYQDGTIKDVVFPPGDQVFSEDTSETISRMLTTVVDDALAGGTVALPHHSIAAKTGTAQIADQVNGGYYDDRFLHSFFGYFPAYDPEFLIFLYTVEPKGVRYASETLTNPFMELAKFLINYYTIPPDR